MNPALLRLAVATPPAGNFNQYGWPGRPVRMSCGQLLPLTLME